MAMRIEGMTGENFTQLITKAAGRENNHSRRGAQPLVSGDQYAAFVARALEHRGAVDTRVKDSVGAKQPQPSRQPREHPVYREFRKLVQI